VPSLVECLTKVTGLSRDDRVAANQIAKLHIKAGLSKPEAEAKAVSDMLDTVRKDYNLLEAEVGRKGGHIDPVGTFAER